MNEGVSRIPSTSAQEPETGEMNRYGRFTRSSDGNGWWVRTDSDARQGDIVEIKKQNGGRKQVILYRNVHSNIWEFDPVSMNEPKEYGYDPGDVCYEDPDVEDYVYSFAGDW